MWIALQPNGEHIRLEHWVVEAWFRKDINDPFVTDAIRNAVQL